MIVTSARRIPDAGINIELEPLATGVEKGPGEDQAEVMTALGKRNLVRLGAPHSSDYVATLLEHGTLPGDIEADSRNGYDFRRVRLSLTMLPDRECMFLAVELSVELHSDPRDGAAIDLPRPLAYLVEPDEVLWPVETHETSRSGLEVGAEAGIGPGKLLAKWTRENSVERDGVRYIRERYSYGVNFSEVGWRLQTGGAAPLEGDVSDLAFVARVPSNARLAGRFHIVAEVGVETGLDRWLTRVFGARSGTDKPLDAVYPLDD